MNILRSIGKQSGKSVESVLKKKKRKDLWKRNGVTVRGSCGGINRAGCRRDRISGDAACGADWVPLTVDNRLTTIESSIVRT